MDKRNILYFAIIIVLAGIIVYMYFSGGSGSGGKVANVWDIGVITNVDVGASKLYLASLNDGERVFFVEPETIILDQGRNKVEFSYLRKGFSVKVFSTSDRKFYAKSIEVTEEPNIIVYSPKAEEEAGFPMIIEGEARVFENTFNYRISDEDGTVLAEGSAMSESPDAGVYGHFKIEANYSLPKGASGTLEVFDYSAKDGSEIDKVTVPVKFRGVESMAIKVFLGNLELNPGAIDCSEVFPVERRIFKTQAVARAALEELLKGVSASEAKSGYYTSINPGVKIQKLYIENGIAKVDFDQTLGRSVGGSCRVTAIRAEIIRTLKQFPTITDVVISIDGRTEDILQP